MLGCVNNETFGCEKRLSKEETSLFYCGKSDVTLLFVK
jgi:hypothetical protein